MQEPQKPSRPFSKECSDIIAAIPRVYANLASRELVIAAGPWQPVCGEDDEFSRCLWARVEDDTRTGPVGLDIMLPDVQQKLNELVDLGAPGIVVSYGGVMLCFYDKCVMDPKDSPFGKKSATATAETSALQPSRKRKRRNSDLDDDDDHQGGISIYADILGF